MLQKGMAQMPVKLFPTALLSCLAAAALSACANLPGTGAIGAGAPDYAIGSSSAAQLSGADRAALAEAFVAAMDTGQTRQWRGNRAVGVVMPRGYALANLSLDPDARIAASRGDIDLAHTVETDLGLYVLTRNSNIRTGPGTDNEVIEVLPSGAGVEVVGRVVDRNWMLIAADGVVRGYVFQDLLIKAPGTELELAGGPERRPVLCRNFTQRVNVYSVREEWRGAACRDATGWRLAPREEEALLGL